MLTLAANNTLAGGANVASTLTATVMGMELAGTTESYKVLYQGQLPATAATLYTVTASTTAFVKTISVVNNDTVNNRSFQLFINGTAAANTVTQLTTIPPGGSAYYEDGIGWRTYTSGGSLLSGAYTLVSVENYGITGSKAETIPRHLCPEVNTTVAASGTLFMQAIYLRAGTVVTNIIYSSATTAAVTVTGSCVGLYDINRNLLATSANNTTAIGANTQRSSAMLTPYTVTAEGLYYIGYFTAATTVPTLKGGTAKTGGQLAGQVPILQGISNTGLTTSLPASAVALTVSTASIWFAVS